MDKRVAQYFILYSWLFWPTVLSQKALLLPPPQAFVSVTVSLYLVGGHLLRIAQQYLSLVRFRGNLSWEKNAYVFLSHIQTFVRTVKRETKYETYKRLSISELATSNEIVLILISLYSCQDSIYAECQRIAWITSSVGHSYLRSILLHEIYTISELWLKGTFTCDMSVTFFFSE